MWFLSGNVFHWWSERAPVTIYATSLIWLLLSIPCGNSKFVLPFNPNIREVLGYLQEGLSSNESESECVVGSDHNTECVVAER
jgi:hypothetical protein